MSVLTNQRSLLIFYDRLTPQDQAQLTSNLAFQRRYAVFFDEGPGYLLVDDLPRGTNSQTMLVKSVVDQQIYVRKLHDNQLFNRDLREQCSDVQNAISQPNVPRLMCSRTYKFTLWASWIRGTYCTPVSVWEYCNGGSFDNQILNSFSQFEEEVRVPEAVIWTWLSTLFEATIALNLQGIAHSDLHAGNLFMNWRANENIPQVYLGDFGAAVWYPRIADHDDGEHFRRPWRGNYDSDGRPISSFLSNEQKESCRRWHRQAHTDSDHLLFVIRHAVLGTNTNIPDDEQQSRWDTFKMAEHRGQRRNYSRRLIQVFEDWQNILDTHFNDPVRMMHDLRHLAARIQYHATQAATQFESDRTQAGYQTQWMRPSNSHGNKILLWDSTRPLFHPAADSDEYTADMINTQNFDQGRFRLLSSESFQILRPLIEIITPSLSENAAEPLRLRIGQFHVVEVLHEEATGNTIIMNPVRPPDRFPSDGMQEDFAGLTFTSHDDEDSVSLTRRFRQISRGSQQAARERSRSPDSRQRHDSHSRRHEDRDPEHHGHHHRRHRI